MGRRAYPPEFRRKVIGLLKEGCLVGQVAYDLGISEASIYVWRRQDRIDKGADAVRCRARKTMAMSAGGGQRRPGCRCGPPPPRGYWSCVRGGRAGERSR
ncbi:MULTISPECIES: transposase [Nocardioides]|uniref:transposase n=1 Tax=Nocardioides TaxID=1839 RepID=UPI0015C9BF3B